ncbi:MAG: hypothetical protein ACWA5P_10900 [bacterium]
MNNILGTPWDFKNEYPAPNGLILLEFGDLGEVAMGAPLSGECFLNINGAKRKLDGLFGGPIVWSENSEIAAIPYWTKNRAQKLVIIDTKRMRMMISKKNFRVIELSEIKNGLVLGIDSPIYRTEQIKFNIAAEEYLSEFDLENDNNNV